MGGAGRFQKAQVLSSGEPPVFEEETRQVGMKWKSPRGPAARTRGRSRLVRTGLGCLSSERPLPVTRTFRAVNSRGSPTARPGLAPEAGIGVAGSRRCGVGAPEGRPWALGPLCSELACSAPTGTLSPWKSRAGRVQLRMPAHRLGEGQCALEPRQFPVQGCASGPRPVCRLPSCPLTADHAAARVTGSCSG